MPPTIMRHTLTIRIDPSLAVKISDMAHDCRLSQNELVTLVLRKAVERGVTDSTLAESSVYREKRRTRRFPIDEQMARVVVDRYVRQKQSRHRIYRDLGISDCAIVRILQRSGVHIRGPREALDLRPSATDRGAWIPSEDEIAHRAMKLRKARER